jgi:hypothetical protein
MGKVSYKYLPVLGINQKTGKEIITHKPIIYIRFSHHHSNLTQQFEALVDSGSDRNLFPLGIAEILDINYQRGKKVKIMGIGNHIIEAYTLDINIWVDGKKYQSEADFSPEQQTVLLGRRGFFDLFNKIIFDEDRRVVELELKE